MNKHFFIFLILLTFITTTHAAAIKLTPLNCNLSQVRLQDKAIVLNATTEKKHSSIYLIKNNSSSILTLDHVKKKVGAGAGWASTLRPGHWSAISVSQKEFALQCSISNTTDTNLVSCSALKVCQPQSQLTIKSNGYWIAEDKTFNELVEVIQQRKNK